MSEVQKPIEEPTVAAPAAAVEPASTEVKPEIAEKPTTEAPLATVTPAATSTEATTTTEAKKEEAKTEPANEGVVGYKAPGLIKSFIFSKKFFWFQDEPVESKNLANYLRGEKEVAGANHNVAWASHTGKGLLFFSKNKVAEKTVPAGVINLAGIGSEVNADGPNEFHFMLDGHKHTFQANTVPERDSWVSVLKTKVAEAKAMADSVKTHETYKKTHDSLSKSIMGGAAAVAPKKNEEKKEQKKADKIEHATEKKEDKIIAGGNKKQDKEEKKEQKEKKKEEKAEKKEEKTEEKTRTSRSQSRKSQSIFASIPGFKKEDKNTEAKEEKEEKKESSEAPVTSVGAPATVDEAAAKTSITETPTSPTDRPTANKRSSIFGTLKSQFSQHKKPEEKSESTAPAVPAKDTAAEPVSETAPVIPPVSETEPLGASVASPAIVPTTETTAGETPTNGESKAAEPPFMKSDKRKSSLPWLSKKEKAASDEEGDAEKPKSPFAKLRATVKGKASPKSEEKKAAEPASEAKAAEEKKDEKPLAPAATETKPEEKATTEAAPVTTEPVVSEPVSAPSTTPQVSATA